MKNFTYITLVLLVIVSCGRTAPGDKDTSAAENGSMVAHADSVTLNGYTFAEAEIMVRSFLREGYSSEQQTSIWFSKTYIDSLDTILKNEDADGFRIYFAKKDGKNRIVMVATKKTKINHPNDPKLFTHRDHFTIKSPYLQPGNNSEILGTPENGDPGARMHSAVASDCTNVPCNKLINTISCEEGHRWVNQFSKGPITTTSLWYPIELIQSWKLELDSAVANKADGDGIRIYFAKKDNGRNIFVMTSTRIKNGQKRTDYFECYNKILKESIQKKLNVFDNGEECPNNCNDVTWQ